MMVAMTMQRRPRIFLSILHASLFLIIVRASEADDDLLKAAFANDVEGVNNALEHGANPNVQDPASGQTALMGAVLRGNADVVKFLLTSDVVDKTIAEKDGYTLAHGAAFQGRAEIMEMLHRFGINVIDDFHSDGYSPLHRVCWGREARHTDTLRVLKFAGVDLNMPSKDGRRCEDMTTNPLTIALLSGRDEF